MITALRRWAAADLRWLLLAALAVGTLLKLLAVLSPELGRMNSDHAVLYLMARQVPEGELTPWYWGQEYGGSLLPTLLGLLFVVTGPHLWLLPVAIGLTSTLVPVLTWRVGVALGQPAGGAVAGALVAVGPPTWLFFGIASDGFYAVGVVLSLLALILVLRVSSLTLPRAGLVGLLVGAAVWTSPLSYLTALPVLVLLVPLVRRVPLTLAPLAAGGLLGALPVLRSAVRRGTVLPPQFHNDETVGRRVEDAFTGTWTAVWTRFAPHQAPTWLVESLAVVALLAVVAAGVMAVVRFRSDLRTAALVLPFVLWVPFHVRAYLPSDAPASRYALPVLPFLALWVVRLLPGARRAVAAVAGLALYSAVGLWQATGGPSAGGVLHSPAYTALADELREHGRSAVWADYWIAYRLTAETDERITAEPPSYPRRPSYAAAAREAPATTVVVYAGQVNDEAMARMYATDPGVRREVVGVFAVWYADRQVPLPGFAGTADPDQR